MTEVQKVFWIGILIGYFLGVVFMWLVIMLYTLFPETLSV